MKINENYKNLSESYLFSTIAKKVNEFVYDNPEKEVIKLGIGDVTLPLCPAVIESMNLAVKEMSLKETFKGYGPEQGYDFLKESIQKHYLKNDVKLDLNEIFISDGAKSDLGNILDLFSSDNIVLIPDPVYPVYVDTNVMSGRNIMYIDANEKNDFLPLPDFNQKSDIIYICSPNNPTGACYSEDTIKKLASLLEEKSSEYNRAIYIISDEPYREIVFDNFELPYIPKYYKNTLLCYSYSKSLSIPGERIGYIAFTDEAEYSDILLGTIGAIAREISYVGVPSLFQMVLRECVDDLADISVYETNRNLIYKALKDIGYTVSEPKGTFYIFPKCLEDDATAFCEKAKEYDLLLVPSDSFAIKGFFRLSYCVPTSRVERAIPLFEKLYKDYN